ncbi:MAG: armadillo-type protein [Benniella sp.]|nr:MAG: armadillo-type protein [Benniella sp.]
MDVAELAEAFKDQQHSAHQAQLMQRVQELMGQGIDVSSLFANIVSSASTRDVAIKKATYAFLTRYGRTNEELCFLSINTLHQDCADLDPMVRSLALRTLCSLGQKSVLRFTLQPLNKGFQDKNAHVRKTAALVCISLFELDPVFVLESEIVDKLYAMIRDRDTHVVVNAILALEAILVDEGGIVINQNIATHLIQRYKEWNPSQLQVILGILCRYKPQISDDVYEIMNDLDDGIQHSSLAVQMATLRLFIWLCQDVNEVQEELQKTIEETLLKHLESPIPDLVYASLSHLALMVESTGTLCHNTPQHLSALFCRSQDPVPVKLQKLDLCVKIVQSSLSTSAAVEAQTTSDLIFDHLCRVASMKELALTQKSGRTKLDRASMAAPFEAACRAIEAIANVATGVRQKQHNGQQQGPLLSNPQARADDKGHTARSIVKYCLERLFRLLVFFSSMEHVLEKGTDSNSDSWIHTDIADLGLDESQVSLLLSTVLTAIESCWQREFDARQRGAKVPGASGSSGDNSGAFSPFQIKVLGLILLRHLDQGELDRLAKKKKPLRFRYDVEQEDSSLSSSTLGMENSLYEQRQQEPGDMSRLARINGIKMLLLEESAQQLSLQQQLQKVSEATGTTTTTTIDTPIGKEQEAQRADQGKEAKLKALQAALAMRSQYALLLQQQVQDLVQSIDTNGSTRSSNHAYLTRRAEHLAVLNLACHLVAFSVETDHGNGESMSEEAVDLLRRRVDILAQAVDQLIPGSGSRVRSGEDLLSLESMTVGEHSNPPPSPSELGSHVHPPAGVAKDVADRARLVEALFLVPLSKVLVLSLETALDDAPKPTPRTISQANQFDSPLFKTESYLSTVRQKFVAQYGVRTKSFDPESSIDQEPMMLGSMDHAILHDWLTQVGFNTLAVIRSH